MRINEFYGITIGGVILLILSLGDLFSMTASYVALLLVTTFYISISKLDASRGKDDE